MRTLRTSVAVCTYNGALYLREQLASIASQTQLPDEVVVCDDGSTDGTLEILSEFQTNSAFPVRILAGGERLGPAKNFERGIAHCTGEIIVLADQDDVWHATKLARMAQTLADHPEAVYAFSDADMVDETGVSLGRTFWESARLSKSGKALVAPRQLATLANHNVIPGAALAFRASFRELALPIPAGWMHDYWIVLLGSVISCGIPIPESLFSYRRHVNQVCGWDKKSRLQVWMDSFHTPSAEAWRKVEIFQEILERLRALPKMEAAVRVRIDFLSQKEDHLRNRAQARSSRGWNRVVKVLSEVRTGRYQQFSNSWYSILRDI